MGPRTRYRLLATFTLLLACSPGLLFGAYRWSIQPVGGSSAAYDRFTPFQFTLQTDAEFRGVLQMGAGGSGFSLEYPLSVGPGEYRIELPGYPHASPYNGGEFSVWLIDRKSRTSEKKDFSFFAGGNNAMQGQTINWVGSRKAGFAGTSLSQAMVLPVAINRVEPAEVPSDPLLWECADSWIIPGQYIAQLTPEQTQALRQYVRRGGRVRLDTSGTVESWNTHPFLQSLQVTRDDTSAEKKIPVTATVWDPSVDPSVVQQLRNNPGAATGDQVAHKKLQVPVVWLGFTRRGTAVPTDSPWRTGWLEGLGWIDLLPFDLEDFRTRHDSTELMQAFPVLLTGQATYDRLSRLPATDNSRYYYSYRGSEGGNQLKQWTRLKPIPAPLVFLFLLAFVALVGPVEQVFVRRRKITQVTWGTSLVLVVVFSLSAALISRMVRGTACRQTGVTYRDYLPEGGGVDTFSDQFIPSRFRTFSATAADQTVWMPARRMTPYWQYRRQKNGNATFDWSSRTLHVEAPVWATTKFGGRSNHAERPPLARDGEQLVSSVPLQEVYSRRGADVLVWTSTDGGSTWQSPRKMKRGELEPYLEGQLNHAHEMDLEDSVRGKDWALTALINQPDDLSVSWRRSFLSTFPGHSALPPLLPIGADEHELFVGWQLEEPTPQWNYDKIEQRGILLHRQIIPLSPAANGDAS